MKNFRLEIVTPKGTYREVDVEILNIHTPLGQMGILADHIPLATPIEISEMNYVSQGKRYEFAISGGFVYVGQNETRVIANAIESSDEIDEQRALKAKERAERRLKSKNEEIDFMRAQLALKRALTRIRVKERV